MKFEITIGNHAAHAGKGRPTVRGLDRIEDAVAAAHGLAQVQPDDGFVTVWLAKKKSHHREILVQCKRAYNETLARSIESARRNLAILQEQRKQSDERFAWMNRYPNRAFDVLLKDNDARAAWMRNDFAPVAIYFEAHGVQALKSESSVTLAPPL